jgi:hypothetical protein
VIKQGEYRFENYGRIGTTGSIEEYGLVSDEGLKVEK